MCEYEYYSLKAWTGIIVAWLYDFRGSRSHLLVAFKALAGADI